MYPYIARGPASAANACSRHVFNVHRELDSAATEISLNTSSSFRRAGSLPASPQRVMRMKSAPVTCRKGDRE